MLKRLHKTFEYEIIKDMNTPSILKLILLSLFFMTMYPLPMAQAEPVRKKGTIDLVAKDSREKANPKDATVPSEENEEKSIFLKAIESIRVERVPAGIPGADHLTGEEYYSVRLNNSQKVFALQDRYELSINAELGVLLRDIDPQKDPSAPPHAKRTDSFIRDKSITVGFELKF